MLQKEYLGPQEHYNEHQVSVASTKGLRGQ